MYQRICEEIVIFCTVSSFLSIIFLNNKSWIQIYFWRKRIKNVTVFVDESGIIARNNSNTNYFIITLLFVEEYNLDYVKKCFKNITYKLRSWTLVCYNKLLNRLAERRRLTLTL